MPFLGGEPVYATVNKKRKESETEKEEEDQEDTSTPKMLTDEKTTKEKSTDGSSGRRNDIALWFLILI